MKLHEKGCPADEQVARALIADHFGMSEDRVHDDALFQQDLGADSLDLVELAMRFEHSFNIAIDDEETALCITVGDAMRLLRQKAIDPVA